MPYKVASGRNAKGCSYLTAAIKKRFFDEFGRRRKEISPQKLNDFDFFMALCQGISLCDASFVFDVHHDRGKFYRQFLSNHGPQATFNLFLPAVDVPAAMPKSLTDATRENNYAPNRSPCGMYDALAAAPTPPPLQRATLHRSSPPAHRSIPLCNYGLDQDLTALSNSKNSAGNGSLDSEANLRCLHAYPHARDLKGLVNDAPAVAPAKPNFAMVDARADLKLENCVESDRLSKRTSPPSSRTRAARAQDIRRASLVSLVQLHFSEIPPANEKRVAALLLVCQGHALSQACEQTDARLFEVEHDLQLLARVGPTAMLDRLRAAPPAEAPKIDFPRHTEDLSVQRPRHPGSKWHELRELADFAVDVCPEPGLTKSQEATAEQRSYFVRYAEAHLRQLHPAVRSRVQAMIYVCQGHSLTGAADRTDTPARSLSSYMKKLAQHGPKLTLRHFLSRNAIRWAKRRLKSSAKETRLKQNRSVSA